MLCIMQSLETPQLIKYSISPTTGGYMLCIWEPATVTASRVKPFLFMARYRVETESEAEEIITHYRTVYHLDN